MKPSELRIDNKLLTSQGSIATVTWGVIKDIEEGSRFYLPIPLTEDWLLKFGCKKVGYHWETKNGIPFNFDADNKCTLILFGGRHVHFYHVHTFQNIMALAEEELTIKETVK